MQKRNARAEHPPIVRRFLALALITTLAAAPKAEDIIDHLEQSISWYRHLQAVDQASGDVLVRQSIHQASLKALQLAFDFARAESGLVVADQPQQAQASGNLQQASARAADRVNNLQARIADLDTAIQKASAKQRADLENQRRQLNAQLDLAKEIQNTIQTIVNFSGSLGATGATGGLGGQIDELERSVPEAHHDKRNDKRETPAPAAAPNTNNTANAAAPPQVFQPETRGIIGLISDLFSIQSKRKQFVTLENETDALSKNISRLRTPLLDEVRASIRRADEINNGSAPSTQNAQRELTTLSARFKQISAAMIPLSEQAIAVGTVRSYLQESIGDLDENWSKAGRYLLLRAVILGAVIFVILMISAVIRRATFRYIHDTRRRRQFLMIRRVLVTVAIVFTIVLGFISEFGSLATYAGFVTAGIAVALQNPILSVVAYFFLIGRYGLRVGDRVTISGVTGEVIEIGLVRIYLMELGHDLHSTGRVVVFSNSVIFQPAALYKQMPGLDYVWHTVTLTLAPESDFQTAETKLTVAVDSVYQQYRDRIERQYHNLEKSIDVNVAAPHPETRLRFTDAGLEFTARYPAELKEATVTDDRVTKALYDAIAGDPKLKFAPSGRPKVQLAA